jgi:diguanylate cyclase (GGDEF)-like protein
MLTDEVCLAAKAQIINLIDETQIMVNKRTRLAMEKTLKQTEGFFLLLVSAVVVFAASASALFWLEKRRSLKFEKSSFHDPLTKLANRAYLDLYLKLVTSTAKLHDEIVVLAFLDLNGFKGINDIFGHAQGDTVLKSVAKSLLSHVRENDLVARYGGDEFVVVLTDLDEPATGSPLLAPLLAAAAQPIYLGESVLQLSASEPCVEMLTSTYILQNAFPLRSSSYLASQRSSYITK